MIESKAFEVNGVKFQMMKLDAMKQFHIARRIGPILSELLPSLKEIAATSKGMPEAVGGDQMDAIAKVIGPIMMGLSRLSEEDSERLLKDLLARVQMWDTRFNTWVNLIAANQIALQDIELPTLIQIAGQSFAFNLSGFFNARPVS